MIHPYITLGEDGDSVEMVASAMVMVTYEEEMVRFRTQLKKDFLIPFDLLEIP